MFQYTTQRCHWAEQAAAKEALAAVFAVDADEVWRAKVADQM